MTSLSLNTNQFLELTKLAVDCFAPLTGFMDEQQFNAVVDTMRLPNGQVFSLPVVLDCNAEDADRIRNTQTSIMLYYREEIVGEMEVTSVFTCDKQAVALKVFGTADLAHPGVRFFVNGGNWFIGGPVKLDDAAYRRVFANELTPKQTREEFKRLGWNSIVGFQTRNVPHRAHEYLQRVALEHVDGLFIQPLIGRKQKGDYTAEAILAGFRALIEGFYPAGKVLLGYLTTAMRYAGPREAVFHAIIRRNYGCTHFIVGRDHAGVGNFYGKYEAHELSRTFDGELGIEFVRLHGPFYCRICDGIVTEHTCRHFHDKPEATTQISGTMMRSMLSGGTTPDPHLMRPEVISAVTDVPLFIENEEP